MPLQKTATGSLLKTSAGTLSKECCCDDGDCCASMTLVPTLRALQLNPGDTEVIICWCTPDHVCADEFELAWTVSDAGVLIEPITRVVFPLTGYTALAPCDNHPDEAGDGGVSDGCLNSYTITGIATGPNITFEVNMRKRNATHYTASSCGEWIGAWDGTDANWTNGATAQMLP